jgi:rapamycin-insensitive companion of mTOR
MLTNHQIPPWEHRPAEKEAAQLVAPTVEAEIELVTSVQSLANTVIANAASRSLAKYVIVSIVDHYSNCCRRLKSKPEYRSLFTSPTVLYRVLHIISTQRYRLPVRRYIMEMFNVDLNEATVAALEQAAIALKPTPTYEPPKTDISRRVSVFRSGRSRQNSESDEEVEVEIINPKEQPPLPAIAKPAISLRPVSKIIGFAI